MSVCVGVNAMTLMWSRSQRKIVGDWFSLLTILYPGIIELGHQAWQQAPFLTELSS